MENIPQERQRILSLDEATSTFAMQLRIFPELMKEVYVLSGGLIGVVSAIIETVGDEISYDPIESTTVKRIRSIVGAPDDITQLEEWRVQFWDKFKEASRIK